MRIRGVSPEVERRPSACLCVCVYGHMEICNFHVEARLDENLMDCYLNILQCSCMSVYHERSPAEVSLHSTCHLLKTSGISDLLVKPNKKLVVCVLLIALHT